MDTYGVNKRMLTILSTVVLFLIVGIYHFDVLVHINIFVSISIICAVIAFSIFRPAIAFVLFIAVIPVEIMTLIPPSYSVVLRPYQLFGIACFIGIFSRYMRGQKITFKWHSLDALIGIFIGLSFGVLAGATDVGISLRQTIILLSYGVLFFVVRVYVKQIKDVLGLFPIMIGSGWVIALYAIGENVLYFQGLMQHEVMPGRSNATFMEPDWLGMYLVFVFAMCLAYLYYNAHHKHVWKFFDIALYGATFTIVSAVIITAARSAWLGMIVVSVIYLSIIFLQRKYKMCARHALWTGSLVLLGSGFVTVFQVTNFALDDRVSSLGTGQQEITVSCDDVKYAETLERKGHITSIDELSAYACRHINVEEVASEVSAGRPVIMIYRDDPTVAIRKTIYTKTFRSIKENMMIGTGWGSSSVILGTDERGTPLNASNIFFETALSIGIIGAGILMLIFIVIIMRSGYVFYQNYDMMTNAVALFGILGTVAIIVPNFFNTGLFLGFIWIYFGMVAILFNKL